VQVFPGPVSASMTPCRRGDAGRISFLPGSRGPVVLPSARAKGCARGGEGVDAQGVMAYR
jgi:hypothetical protein